MRAFVVGLLGLVLVSSPATALPQSGCSAVTARLHDARREQANAEAELTRSKDRSSAIEAAMETAFGDVLAECGDVYGEAASACVDRLESQQRSALARTFNQWLGPEWLTYPEGAVKYREWRDRGLEALNGERVLAARAGLRALDSLERSLEAEENILLRYPLCPG